MLSYCHESKSIQGGDCAEVWCDFCLLQAKAQNLASICESLLDMSSKKQGVCSRAARNIELYCECKCAQQPSANRGNSLSCCSELPHFCRRATQDPVTTRALFAAEALRSCSIYPQCPCVLTVGLSSLNYRQAHKPDLLGPLLSAGASPIFRRRSQQCPPSWRLHLYAPG